MLHTSQVGQGRDHRKGLLAKIVLVPEAVIVCTKGRRCRSFWGQTFQRNGPDRQRRLQKEPLEPAAADEVSQWSCNPEAETVEAIEQAGPETCPGTPPEPNHQALGAVLARQQERDPPRSEDGQDKSTQEARFLHSVHSFDTA